MIADCGLRIAEMPVSAGQLRELADWLEGLAALGEQEGPEAVSLDVPFLSQWDAPEADRSPGDCGPAAVAMVVHYETNRVPTVDEVAVVCGQPSGSHYTTLRQLRQGADEFGVRLGWVRPLRFAQIRAELEAGRPVIALVHYGALSGRQDQGYRGGHFVVVVGFGVDEAGDYFLLNDPDWQGTRRDEGDHWRVGAAELEQALAQCTSDGNRSFQGLVVDRNL